VVACGNLRSFVSLPPERWEDLPVSGGAFVNNIVKKDPGFGSYSQLSQGRLLIGTGKRVTGILLPAIPKFS
jgi:hypothetical protein